MKKIIYLFLICLGISLPSLAQNEGISFQGLARNTAGEVLVSQKISLRLSILLNSESGAVAYVETRQTTTNPQGIFSLVIGDSNALTKSSDFSGINWGSTPSFIKVEMDSNGGTNFLLMGISRLQAVPFAYSATKLSNAKTINGVAFDGTADITITAPAAAETLTGSTLKSTVTGSSLTSVGTITSGVWSGTAVAIEKGGTGLTTVGTNGQVLTSNGTSITWATPASSSSSSPTYTTGLNSDLGGYVFFLSTDSKHGLVAETQDQSTTTTWYDAEDKISNQANHSTNGKKFTDWRLPTKHELNLMYSVKTSIGGFASNFYWSSTEGDSTSASYQYFGDGAQNATSKFNSFYVRPVRAF